jgi:hypothetical protein
MGHLQEARDEVPTPVWESLARLHLHYQQPRFLQVEEAGKRLEVKVYAWCVMTAHQKLVATNISASL